MKPQDISLFDALATPITSVPNWEMPDNFRESLARASLRGPLAEGEWRFIGEISVDRVRMACVALNTALTSLNLQVRIAPAMQANWMCQIEVGRR